MIPKRKEPFLSVALKKGSIDLLLFGLAKRCITELIVSKRNENGFISSVLLL